MSNGIDHRDPYLVVGTGRCGTSFVDRILHENLGVYMGKIFRPTNRNNPDGNYEDAEFNDLNKLHITGQLNYQEYATQLQKVVDERRSLKRPWGVKDPMLSYNLGLWLSFFQNPKIIRCKRRPDLVIKSLMRCYDWKKDEATEFFERRERALDRLLRHVGLP